MGNGVKNLKCNNCNTELREGAKFCPKCGGKVETPVKEDDNMIICSKCGTEYKKEFVVCPSCGNIYEEPKAEEPIHTIPVCPSCGKELAPGKAFCKYCGTKLNSDEAKMPEIQVSPAQEIPTPPTQQLSNSGNSELGFMAFNEFIVDEKVSAFKFSNSYKVYDMSGNLVGAVIQENVSAGAKAARMLVGKSAKGLQKFRLNIVSADGKRLAAIYRDGGAFANVIVENGSGRTVSTMKLRMGVVFDDNKNAVCKFGFGIKTIPIRDLNGNDLATIIHKWNGAKSIFTTADKYHISLSPSLSGEKRLIIAALTLAYDMLTGDR